ncbi:hypothetical protein HF288_06340 [Acidithiobacillus caldus]|uniref:hypothetical protein n=1 Tax=Acidithiobacillus caldus TaxID=33059 RepID=UPI001C06972F|nr:hypothetical protein [Acidithiobacillus caldus]MBU2790055.1 hypothetical protein [Acidithiobacillus caldus]MBU2820938.1 hypothetical protein [Acidithiobacillus caldus]
MEQESYLRALISEIGGSELGKLVKRGMMSPWFWFAIGGALLGHFFGAWLRGVL